MSDVQDEFGVDTGRTFVPAIYVPTNAERLASLLMELSFQELLGAEAAIRVRITAVAAEEKDKLMKSAAVVAAHFGVTPEALFAAPATKRASRKKDNVVKFTHPDDPNKTWSGKGRKPAWVSELPDTQLAAA